jgi:hypothetical protein
MVLSKLKVTDYGWYSSKFMQKHLKVSGCELMHLREKGRLEFKKSGNAFLYRLPSDYSLLQHPLGLQLLNWYKSRHPFNISNTPQSEETIRSLEKLVAEVLIPVGNKFGPLQITYGFTSAELTKYIAKNSPAGTAPKLDQHASCEVNSKNNHYCERYGAACDFVVDSNKNIMHLVAEWINDNLSFDRIYFYGTDRPIHISVGPDNSKFIQMMGTSSTGKRVPMRNGSNIKFLELWDK